MAFVIPLRPSVTAIKMSLQPRVLISLNTLVQYAAPSLSDSHIPRTSREPSPLTAKAKYRDFGVMLLPLFTFTLRASKKTTG